MAMVERAHEHDDDLASSHFAATGLATDMVFSDGAIAV
jgi:hypothetical protein